MKLPAFVKWSIFLLVPATEVICSVNIDGSNYREYKTGTGSPLIVSLTRSENILFWITLYNGKNGTFLLCYVRCFFPFIPAGGIKVSLKLLLLACACNQWVIVVFLLFLLHTHEFFAGTTDVWYSDGIQPKQLWFEVQTNIIALKAYSENSQKGTPIVIFSHTVLSCLSLLLLPFCPSLCSCSPGVCWVETVIELKPCDTCWLVELVQVAAFQASPFK